MSHTAFGASIPGQSDGSSQVTAARAKMDEEVTLWESSRDRGQFDDMADLFAIIKTTEHLERAYVRDAVTQEEYTNSCARLISQFKTAEATLRSSHAVTDAQAFAAYYRMDCPRAMERLLKFGVPATVLHATTNSAPASANVAKTVQHFITAMDSLKLNMRAVDEIQPLIADLLSSLNKVPNMPADFDGKSKIEQWLVTLNRMRASDELDEDQARQLSFELENSYATFMNHLAAT